MRTGGFSSYFSQIYLPLPVDGQGRAKFLYGIHSKEGFIRESACFQKYILQIHKYSRYSIKIKETGK